MIEDFDTKLDHHLQFNHVPAVPVTYTASAREAIVHAEDGDWEHEIILPNGRRMSVRSVVNGLHLAPFINYP